MGRKCLAIKHLQATLKYLQRQLDDGLAKNRYSILGPLVGPVYDMNQARRQVLKKQGESVSKAMDVRLAEKAKEIQGLGTDDQSSIFAATEEPEKFEGNLEHESFNDHGDTLSSIFGIPAADDLVSDVGAEAPTTEHAEAPYDSADADLDVERTTEDIPSSAIPAESTPPEQEAMGQSSYLATAPNKLEKGYHG